MTENFLTISEVAALLRCSKATVRRRIAAGEIGCTITGGGRRGKTLIVAEGELQRFLSAHKIIARS